MRTATLCVLLLASFHCGSATLHELAGFVPHPRIARQVGQSETMRCSNVLLQTQCSTTNYAQGVLNDIGKCGSDSMTYISTVERACRKNNGDYCGSVLLGSIDSLFAIPGNCSSSCTTQCRTNLRSVLDSAGCCATSISAINILIAQYLPLCNLSLPSACPASSLGIPSTSSGSCSFAYIQKLIFGFRCRQSNVQPILSALKSANCANFASAVESDCSYRNGQYCYESILQMGTNNALAGAISQCTSDSNCSSGCQTQIRGIDNDFGCCINSLNATFRQDVSDNLVPRTITSYNLWTACGVNPPAAGECEVRFTAGECEVRFSTAASLCGNIFMLVAFLLVLMMP